MATLQELSDKHCRFIEAQPLFFVATAAREGRVNLSPKGMNTLRIMDKRRILWLNLTGSGNETAAHLRELPRMTMMFCAFEGDPLILRVYGSAKVLHPRDEAWSTQLSLFPPIAGSRQVFDLSIDMVQTSCGSGVPIMRYQSERADSQLAPFYDKMGPQGVRAFWQKKNSVSIDGKPTGIFTDS
ncbi:MAG: pyridoxamine 5'-phosphate oxidase family protein [Pseudomonadota bacterium]